MGCGKTTQSKLFVEWLKKKRPKEVVVWTKEPGGTEIAQEIRKIAQALEYGEEMTGECEAYLYAAARAQSIRKVVKGILERGGWVVADRSVFSSLAFQGYGRGLGWKKVWEINKVAVGKCLPDKVVWIDITVGTAMERARDRSGDKFESYAADFFEKVKTGYQMLAKKYKDKFIRIDGSGTREEVFGRISRCATMNLTFNINGR